MQSSSQIQLSLQQKVKSETESPDWHVRVNGRHPPSGTAADVSYCPGHAWVKGNVRADRLASKASIASALRLGISEVMGSLRHYTCWPKAGTPHYRSPGGVRRGKRKRSAIFRERTRERERESHRQSDEHWNRFKGKVGETSDRRSGAHNYGFFQRIETILN